jgi:hypothetical protein
LLASEAGGVVPLNTDGELWAQYCAEPLEDIHALGIIGISGHQEDV